MLTRRATLALFTLAPADFALTPRMALAAEPPVFQDPTAITAIDPIGYFPDDAPVPGLAEHAVSWNGATWHFTSAENAAMLEAEPETYAPVFGGHCAFAASRGYLAPTVPETWTVYEGKLYRNASLRARELWPEDVPGNIAKGLETWPGILG